jgi:hypothetical protein
MEMAQLLDNSKQYIDERVTPGATMIQWDTPKNATPDAKAVRALLGANEANTFFDGEVFMKVQSTGIDFDAHARHLAKQFFAECELPEFGTLFTMSSFRRDAALSRARDAEARWAHANTDAAKERARIDMRNFFLEANAYAIFQRLLNDVVQFRTAFKRQTTMNTDFDGEYEE